VSTFKREKENAWSLGLFLTRGLHEIQSVRRCSANDSVVEMRRKKRKIPLPSSHKSTSSFCDKCSESLGGIEHLVLRLNIFNWGGKREK
jgi:hypothetical protein